MRATDFHRAAYDLRNAVRPIDMLAAALGYGLMLAFVVFVSVSALDFLADRPAQAWQQVHALLAWIDGGRP